MPGKFEGQHVDAQLHEAALVQLLPEHQGHTLLVEGLPSLARGEPGLLAQPVDAPVAAVLGLLLQHLQEGGQCIAVASDGEARYRPRSHGGSAGTGGTAGRCIPASERCPSSGHPRHSQVCPEQAVVDFQVRLAGQGERRGFWRFGLHGGRRQVQDAHLLHVGPLAAPFPQRVVGQAELPGGERLVRRVPLACGVSL